MKIINKKAGFSYVEIIMYMGILSLLLLVLTDIIVSSLGVKLESEANSSIAQDAHYLLARFSYDIQRAQSVTLPLNLGDVTNSLNLVIQGTSSAYFFSNGYLKLQNENGTNNLNSVGTTVSNLSFKKIGNANGTPSVQIVFTLTSVVNRPGGVGAKSYQTTIGLR